MGGDTACLVRIRGNNTANLYPQLSRHELTEAEGDKRGLGVISRDVMSSEPAAGDKRSALDAPDTDNDDGCAEQGEGAGAVGPKPEQAGARNKKLRRDGEVRISDHNRERSMCKQCGGASICEQNR